MYFKHDVHALDDRQLRRIVRKYHSKGYSVFFTALEILYKEFGEPIEESDLVLTICDAIYEDEDEVSEIIDMIVEQGIFERSEDGLITSARVSRACEEARVISETKAKAGVIGGKAKAEKKKVSKQNSSNKKTCVKQMPSTCQNDVEANAKHMPDTCQANAKHMPIYEDKDKDKDKEEERKKESKKKKEREQDELSFLPSFLSLPSILRKDGSEFKTTEQYITCKQKAFPKVDVMQEFWKMQAKTKINPQCRPFFQNLDGFVNNWLQRATDAIEKKEAEALEREKNKVCNEIDYEGTYLDEEGVRHLKKW